VAQLTGLTLEQLPKAVLPAGKPSPSSLRQPAEMTAAEAVAGLSFSVRDVSQCRDPADSADRTVA